MAMPCDHSQWTAREGTLYPELLRAKALNVATATSSGATVAHQLRDEPSTASPLSLKRPRFLVK